jgi:beta-glucosidase
LDEAVEVAEPYKYVYEFNPQYEFGHGLSYTSFSYAGLSINKDTLSGSDSLKVSVTVSNTGKRAGHEVVMLYSRDLYASITPSVKRLRRFQKLFLNVGESKTVSFYIRKEDLAFVNDQKMWVTEQGDFELMVKDLKRKFFFK